MEQKEKDKWIEEITKRGYTRDNFKCVNGNKHDIDKDDFFSFHENYPDAGKTSISWGNIWILLDEKWAEFLPGKGLVKKEITNFYEIY